MGAAASGCLESLPDQEAWGAGACGAYEQAMMQLPYDQRETVVLHLQAGMKFREIAASQEVSVNTIQSRYRYGLRSSVPCWTARWCHDRPERIRECDSRPLSSAAGCDPDYAVVRCAGSWTASGLPATNTTATFRFGGLTGKGIPHADRKTQLAVAAIVLAAVVLGVSLFHDGAQPAYAVGQTIDAIQQVRTGVLKGEFYRQGPFECWLRSRAILTGPPTSGSVEPAILCARSARGRRLRAQPADASPPLRRAG